MKLLLGYQRSLHFEAVPIDAARREYLDLRAGRRTAYTSLQDFMARWLKAASLSYVTVVPLLMLVVPPIQRFVMRQAGLPAR